MFSFRVFTTTHNQARGREIGSERTGHIKVRIKQQGGAGPGLSPAHLPSVLVEYYTPGLVSLYPP